MELRWEAGLFGAAVIHVHSSGKVDVKYDIDGSTGLFLTAKKHGLKLLGDEEKKGGGEKKKRVCSVGGCSNKVHGRGLCSNHRKKPCSVDGCSTKAKARGLCQKHGGGLGECLREGCTTAAVKKGRLCFKHTVKLSCADPDCDTPQILGRFVCIKHGAFGYCTADACINNAVCEESARNATARQWHAPWKAAATLRKQEGFAVNMAPMGPACLTSAPLPSKPEAGASRTAVAAGKCAKKKVAPLLRKHAASVVNMVHVELATSQGAPPTPTLDLCIAPNTAAERRSRAPWRDAPPTLTPRGSAQNTVAVQASACLADAPTRW